MKNTIATLRESYHLAPRTIKALFALSFFAAFFVLAPVFNVILEFKPGISDFSKHILSNGALHDIDASSRVSLYYGIFIAMVCATVGIFMLMYRRLWGRLADFEQNANGLAEVFNLAMMGIVTIFAGLLLANAQSAAIILMALCVFQMVIAIKRRPHYYVDNIYWLVGMGIPFSVLLFELLDRFTRSGFFSKPFVVKGVQLPLSGQELFFNLIFIAVCVVLWFLLKYFFRNCADENEAVDRQKKLFLASIPAAAIVLVQSIMLEAFNILNVRYAYVFDSPRKLFAAIAVLAIALGIVLYLRVSRRTIATSDLLSKYHFPLVIVSLAAIFVQPWRTMYAENEFFEFANHGISVDHFFRYGSLPIVETFDAHMLSNELFAYLYGFLNGYEPFSPFLYATFDYMIFTAMVYFLLKRLTGPKVAFLLAVVFPMMDVFGNHYIVSGLVALQLVSFREENTSLKWYFCFWGAIIALLLYKLDIGFAAFVSGILTYFIAGLVLKKPLAIKRFLLTALISFGSMLLLFVVLCMAKSINPIARLKQFITVAQSNQNFIIEEMGDANTVLFRIAYYSLPIIMIGLMVLVSLRTIFERDFIKTLEQNKTKQIAFVFFVFFALFFCFNVPRGIVRHTLAFNILLNITSTIPLALFSLMFLWGKAKNILPSLLVIVAAYFFTNLNTASFAASPTNHSLLSRAVTSPRFKEKFEGAFPFKGTRVVMPSDSTDVQYFRSLIDAILKPGETYFDFSSINYYHALVGRKNPIYENQTILLNGDDAQDVTIAELRKKQVTVVLMPKSNNFWRAIDGVFMDYKYYKISEYIYQNFVPFAEIKSAVVYVRKDKQQLYANQSSLQKTTGDVTVSDFSKVNLGLLNKNNLAIESKPEEGLVLTPTGTDPYLFDFLPQIAALKNFQRGTPFTLTLQYDSASAGSVQFFYIPDGQDNFSEENSKINAVAQGPGSIAISLPALPKNLRIDCDVSRLAIKQMHFKADSNNSALLPEVPNYNLIDIARVWGEKADGGLFGKVKALGEQPKIASGGIILDPADKIKKPMYVMLSFVADTVHQVKVNVFNNNNQIRGEYYFTTVKGRQNQVIRLSTNYYWWNDKITTVAFVADKAVLIDKFALISADGSFQKSFSNTDLTLSSISDENWYGGVGLKQNAVIMDKSEKAIAALKGATKLVLADGSEIHIAKYYETGNFLTIEIVEPVGQFKDKAASPNKIKIAK